MPIYEFEGKRPRISKTAFVHPNAVIIGDVSVGERCYVGAGAVLRGDFGTIEVCDGANVQENCVIHVRPNQKAFLSKDTHIGHGAILHGPKISDNVLVGMGAILLDDVTIGKDSIIGAGTLIPEGTIIGEGELITGVPGKVSGGVDERLKGRKVFGTRLYQELADRCLRSLKEIPIEEASK